MEHRKAIDGSGLAVSARVISLPDNGWLALTVTEPEGEPVRGTVLVPSTYGKRQESFSGLSASLALNGWRAVKFDIRFNEGVSYGGIYDFSFLSMIDDIVVAGADTAERYGDYAILATSLAARAVMRASSSLPSLTAIAFILPVVHAGATADAASPARPYWKWQNDVDRDLSTGDLVDGFLVSRRFIATAIEADLLSAESVQRDLSSGLPVSAVFSRDDAWVDSIEAEEIFAAANVNRRSLGLPEHDAFFVDGVSHELGRNPVMFRQVLDIIMKSLANQKTGDVMLHAPFRLTAQVLRAERDLLRSVLGTQPTVVIGSHPEMAEVAIGNRI